jgi:hypothetical protein
MAKYLIRLDDASHNMNLHNWEKISNILYFYNIKPIVAVVPNNQDSKISYNILDNAYFWGLIKYWEKKDWTIAMHGYNHIMDSCNKKDNLIPLYNRSEFSALSNLEQEKKIISSIEIFKQNKINPTCFVAPAHAFNKATLAALAKHTQIRLISDGFAMGLFKYLNFYWIPQQTWSFKKRLIGDWTICLHPNTMTNEDFENLESFISINNKYMTDVKKMKKSFFFNWLNVFINLIYTRYFIK